MQVSAKYFNPPSMNVVQREDVTQVFLERMPQQQGLIGDEDDWTGVIDTVQRRRLQNRINQRLYSEFAGGNHVAEA